MKDERSGIYAIISPSGKLYLGSAVNFRRRWNGHRTRLSRGVHHNPGLQRACEKYGLSSLRFEVVELVPPSDLITAEQAYLNELAGILYNANPTAGSRLGSPQSTETRRKISAGLKGHTRSTETRLRMAAAQRGRIVSAASRQKISKAGLGRPQSAETRAKRAAALVGLVHKDNRTGYSGVGPFRDRWRARWANMHLGLFDTPELAHAAICAARGVPA